MKNLKRNLDLEVTGKSDNKAIYEEYKHLSRRIVDLGTGLIPLINNSEKCYCERSCSELCLNRLNHQECNRNICGLSDHLHDVYCNNKPFLRLQHQKKQKYIVERFRNQSEKEIGITDTTKKGNIPQILTKLVLMDKVTKGELIIECKGEVLTNIDVRNRYYKYFGLRKTDDENVMNKKYDEIINVPERVFCLVEDFIYLDMTEIGNEGRHIRHSCDPNSQGEVWISRPMARSMKTGIGNEYTVTWIKMGIFALKDLEKGTEITIDYENLMSRCIPGKGKNHENSTCYLGIFECNCNSKNCRKIIGTREFPKEYDFSEYLIPIPNKKRRKNSDKSSPKPFQTLENDRNSFNKNSFDEFINLREEIVEDQKNWKEVYKKRNIKNSLKSPSSLFEYDKNKILEMEKSISRTNKSMEKFSGYSNDRALWYLFSSICWQGFPNPLECCNNNLPHNHWWNKITLETEKKVVHNISVNFRPIERPRRNCSKKNFFVLTNKKYEQNFYCNSLLNPKKKSIFLHLMTHPWLLSLYSLTNVDIEFGRIWKSFLIRSIELGRWFIVQRLSIFFKLYEISDEELSWPLIDRGLGDDEKCIVCSFHGTLFSCDICSRSIHKSCLKKCNKFIASTSFRLPNWFSSKNITKEFYFRELINQLFLENKRNLNKQNKEANNIRFTVIYNPFNGNARNTIEECKDTGNDFSKPFICHRCCNSSHVQFWLKLKGREKRIVAKNAMKMRFRRAYHSNFYKKSIFVKNNKKECVDLDPKLNRRKAANENSQKNSDIRSAKIIISGLFLWRQNNNKFRISDKNRNIFNELSRNFEMKKKIDPRWDVFNNNPKPSSLKCSLISNDFVINKAQMPKFDEISRFSISRQEDCQIVNSISIEEFIKLFKNC